MTASSSAVLHEPETDFAALGLRKALLDALASRGWNQPTPVQAEAFGPACQRLDLVVEARTGTGKTGAFVLPLLDRLLGVSAGLQALVLAPTREIAAQSGRELAELGAATGHRVATVYGGVDAQAQINALKSGAQVVSGTPGRVLDLMERDLLDVAALRVLVLDEADEMLSMGFARELDAILKRLPSSKQTLLFSATITPEVLRFSKRTMREPRVLRLSGDEVGARGLTHLVYLVSGMSRSDDLRRILEFEQPRSAIVFCSTKVETQLVAQQLQRLGFGAEWLNGDLAQREREAILKRTREEATPILVATDVAARGVDISHLTHVINYSLPESAEQYIHRTGRTGRAGKTGIAISLVAPQEIGTLYMLRLRYGLDLHERSLPSKGEEKSQREADRLAFLASAFAEDPSEECTALARRLWVHQDGERIVAGLLQTFLSAYGVFGLEHDQRRALRGGKVPSATVAVDRAEVASEQERSPRQQRRRPRRRRSASG